MREGVAGLLYDKTREPGLPPLPPAAIERVVELTLAEPPGEATHWTGRAMAAGQRHLAAFGAAHLDGARSAATPGAAFQAVAGSRRSSPNCATSLGSGILDPPAHSLVLSVDEKSQIQALDRTPAGPTDQERSGPGRCRILSRANASVKTVLMLLRRQLPLRRFLPR